MALSLTFCAGLNSAFLSPLYQLVPLLFAKAYIGSYLVYIVLDVNFKSHLDSAYAHVSTIQLFFIMICSILQRTKQTNKYAS